MTEMAVIRPMRQWVVRTSREVAKGMPRGRETETRQPGTRMSRSAEYLPYAPPTRTRRWAYQTQGDNGSYVPCREAEAEAVMKIQETDKRYGHGQ